MKSIGAKVGDVVYSRQLGNEIVIVGKVFRVTPSGRFFVGTTEYNPDGYQRGSGRYWVRVADELILAEAKQQGERRRLEGRYTEVRARSLTDDQLVRIVAILDEKPEVKP